MRYIQRIDPPARMACHAAVAPGHDAGKPPASVKRQIGQDYSGLDSTVRGSSTSSSMVSPGNGVTAISVAPSGE